jgi:hypothetical protein
VSSPAAGERGGVTGREGAPLRKLRRGAGSGAPVGCRSRAMAATRVPPRPAARGRPATPALAGLCGAHRARCRRAPCSCGRASPCRCAPGSRARGPPAAQTRRCGGAQFVCFGVRATRALRARACRRRRQQCGPAPKAPAELPLSHNTHSSSLGSSAAILIEITRSSHLLYRASCSVVHRRHQGKSNRTCRREGDGPNWGAGSGDARIDARAHVAAARLSAARQGPVLPSVRRGPRV